jgi:hypothetical protein
VGELRYCPSICLEGLWKTTRNVVMVAIVAVKVRTEYLPNKSVERYWYAIPLGMRVLLRTRCLHGHRCGASHHSHHKRCSCGREMNQIMWGREMDGVAVGKGLCVRNGTPETPPAAHMPRCRVTLLPAGFWSREFWFHFVLFVFSGGLCCAAGFTAMDFLLSSISVVFLLYQINIYAWYIL